VLDNADELSALPAAGRLASDGAGWLRSTNSGLILVTSRISDPQIWGRLAIVQPVAPLDDADGAGVLMDLAPGAGDAADAAALSVRLGCLPLALYQAGSYLRSAFAVERSFATYLQAFTARFDQLMGGEGNDRMRVVTTWEPSLTGLESHGRELARPLLYILSCFAAPVPIPNLLLDKDVLGRHFEDIADIQAGLAGLREVGLIEIGDSPKQSDWPSVVVHSLLAEAMRHQAGDALGESVTIAVDLLGAVADQLDHEDSRDWARWLSVLPHLQALLSYGIPLPEAVLATLARAAAELSLALAWAGVYPGALDVAASALKRTARIGNDNPQFLRLRFSRATVLLDQGHSAEAVAEFREILDSQLTILNPDHSETLATRHQLASALNAQGKFADAEAEFRDVLDTRKRVLGTDHPHTLATRHQLAGVLINRGKLADAEAEFRQVLAAKLRVLESGHSDTLTTRHQLAYLLLARGKFAEAEAEYRQVLAARLLILDPDHPLVLATRHEIGRALLRQGKAPAAEIEFRRVLVVKLAGSMGPDHPDTLTTRHAIAVTLAAQGKSAEAESEHRQVLADRLRIHGEDHPNSLFSRHSIAITLAAQGKSAEAEPELRQVLADRLRVLGPDHPDTLSTRHEIAVTLAAQGKSADAEPELRQVLADRLRILGPDHPDTLSTRHEIAVTLAAQGRRADAESEHRQVLADRLRILGPDHPHTISTDHWVKRLEDVNGS